MIAWALRIGLFVAALAGFAATFAPASFFLPSREGGFSYARADGAIWRARFTDVSLSGLDAGEMSWRLSLFDLVQGRMRANIAFTGGVLTGNATLLANGEGDRRLIAPMLQIAGAPFLQGAALEGQTALREADVYFDDGRCAWAQGRMSTDILAENEEAFAWRGPPLIGEARCAGDVALISIEGGGAGGVFRSDISFRADGGGAWRVEARSVQPALASLLGGSGFIISPQDNLAHTERAFQWLPQ